MAFHAVGDGMAPGYRGLDLHPDEPVHPSGGRLRGRWPHAMCEVAVRVFEPGAVAEGAIDEVRLRGIGQRIHVDFHRLEQLLRRIGDLAMDRLAADDHELVEPDGVGGGPDHVLEVGEAHLPDLREDLAPFRLAQRAGERG